MQNKEFSEKWLEAFANTLSKEQTNKVGIGVDNGFLWHAFSFNLVSCLKGEAARQAYYRVDKSDAKQAFYEICSENPVQYAISDEEPITSDYSTASKIDESDKVEVYIIGKDFKWCYIRTHEILCGPYFCSR